MYFRMSRPCTQYDGTQYGSDSCLWPFTIGGLALLLTVVSTGLSAQESVDFHYNPPEGTIYEVAFEAVQKQSMVKREEAKSKTENILIKKTVSIERVDGGWVEHHDVKSLEMYRNGQFVNNPLINATLKRSLQYRISTAGEMQEVTGYEGVLSELQGALPDRVMNRISHVLKPESLKIRDIVEWNGRFGGLAGQTKEVGSTEVKTVPQQLPSGKLVEFEAAKHFIGWEDCGGKRCFRIELTYSSGLQKTAEKMLQQTRKKTEMLQDDVEGQAVPEQVGTLIKGKNTLVLDPETMLPYREQQDRFFRMTTDLPGLGRVPVEQSSRKTMTYVYPQ